MQARTREHLFPITEFVSKRAKACSAVRSSEPLMIINEIAVKGLSVRDIIYYKMNSSMNNSKCTGFTSDEQASLAKQKEIIIKRQKMLK